MNNKNKKKNKRSFLNMLFIEMFGGREKMYMLEEEMDGKEKDYSVEEEMQSPFMATVRTFLDNKTAMFGLITFLVIFAIVLIGPMVRPLDLSFSETSQQHVPPGKKLMKFPDAIDGDARGIAIGPTFSIGVSKDGKPYIWGETEVTRTIDMKDMPEDMDNIVNVAAGTDHALALSEDGTLYAWGSSRQRQAAIPDEVEKANIKDIVAGYQISIVITEDGETIAFGNTNNNDYTDSHEYQGKIEKVSAGSSGVLGLTTDGEVVYLGRLDNALSKVPEIDKKVVDIASTANTMAALDEDGKVYVWGNISRSGLGNVPEDIDGKIVELRAGRTHYVGITDKDNAVAWGEDFYNQSSVPEEYTTGGKVENIYTGYYQNYVVEKSNSKLGTWGLKGYTWGTDELGRDIFDRVLNGGKMTITIGMIATVISTIIGIIIGGISGFFGGSIDQILQRISEMVASLPQIPLIMILNAILGNKLNPTQKIRLVMVILGVLGWTGLQRLVRSQVLSIREQEYVTAARSIGIKQGTIIFKHIIPNVVSVIVVSTTLRFAGNMLTEASLSFLGFGVLPPQPTWGNMLNGAKNSVVIQNYWWRWVFTSIALSITIISINLVGDGLRDAIDPRSQER